MKAMITLLNLKGVNTFQKKTTRNKRAFLRDFEAYIDGLGSSGLWGKGDIGVTQRLPGYIAGLQAANAVVTPTAVNVADTVTLNGQALTAIQQRATGTLTSVGPTLNDTCVINGVTFTAVTGSPVGNQFDRSLANDTLIAADLVRAINASTTAGIVGVVAAKSAAGVVTVFAIAPGTAGNALTLVGTAIRLAASGATLSGGIAVANNQFDSIGTDISTASSLADCINASSTAIVSGLARACARSATITLAGTTDGQTVTIGNVTFRAKNGAAGSLFDIDQFDVSGSDTAKATSLTTQINAHPLLNTLVWADSSAGVVTVRERPPGMPTLLGTVSALSNSPSSFPTPQGAIALAKSGAGITVSAAQLIASAAVLIEALIPGQSGNAQTIASSNAGRLPILGSATRLANGTDLANTF